MNEKQSTQQNPMGKVIAKALQDEGFKKKLIADPAGTLKAEGLEVPAGKTVKVVADTENTRHIVLPAISGAVTDEMLESIAAGNSWGTRWGAMGNSWGPAWRTVGNSWG